MLSGRRARTATPFYGHVGDEVEEVVRRFWGRSRGFADDGLRACANELCAALANRLASCEMASPFRSASNSRGELAACSRAPSPSVHARPGSSSGWTGSPASRTRSWMTWLAKKTPFGVRVRRHRRARGRLAAAPLEQEDEAVHGPAAGGSGDARGGDGTASRQISADAPRAGRFNQRQIGAIRRFGRATHAMDLRKVSSSSAYSSSTCTPFTPIS